MDSIKLSRVEDALKSRLRESRGKLGSSSFYGGVRQTRSSNNKGRTGVRTFYYAKYISQSEDAEPISGQRVGQEHLLHR